MPSPQLGSGRMILQTLAHLPAPLFAAGLAMIKPEQMPADVAHRYAIGLLPAGVVDHLLQDLIALRPAPGPSGRTHGRAARRQGQRRADRGPVDAAVRHQSRLSSAAAGRIHDGRRLLEFRAWATGSATRKA